MFLTPSSHDLNSAGFDEQPTNCVLTPPDAPASYETETGISTLSVAKTHTSQNWPKNMRCGSAGLGRRHRIKPAANCPSIR